MSDNVTEPEVSPAGLTEKDVLAGLSRDARKVFDTFPPEAQKAVVSGLIEQRKLQVAQAEVQRRLDARRRCINLASAYGVTGYKLKDIFEVSQTTIANWRNKDFSVTSSSKRVVPIEDVEKWFDAEDKG